MTDANTLTPCPHLESCPWCGCALYAVWRRANPRASCKTEGCFGRKMAVVNLDDPSDVAAWNCRSPSPASQPVAVPTNGWLRDESMVYRLTDQRIPSNRDEINITMVDGSRDLDRRKEQAERIRQMLSVNVAAPAGMEPVATVLFSSTGWRTLVDALASLEDGTKLYTASQVQAMLTAAPRNAALYNPDDVAFPVQRSAAGVDAPPELASTARPASTAAAEVAAPIAPGE